QSDTELGLLGAERDGPESTDGGMEAADRLEHGPSEGHVAAERVPNSLDRSLAPEGAADHPEVLLGEPARRRRLPARDGLAAHDHRPLAPKSLQQSVEPARDGL